MESYPASRRGGRDEAVNRLPPGQRVFLFPGEYLVVRRPLILSTLLGSCVAACLYDPKAGVAGMNHFLLPDRTKADTVPLGATAAGRYGIMAMELLINTMLKAGASKSRIRAKVFGGATLLVGSTRVLSIGESNCRFIRAFLSLEGIPVTAEVLGGRLGRVIHFHTDTFYVWHRPIKSLMTESKVAVDEDKALDRLRTKVGSEGDVTMF